MRSRRAGVTLVEIIFALAILATVMALALSLMSNSMTAMAVQSVRLATDMRSQQLSKEIQAELSETKSSFCSSVRLFTPFGSVPRPTGTGALGGSSIDAPVGWPVNWFCDVLMYPKCTNFGGAPGSYGVATQIPGGGPFLVDPVFNELYIIAPYALPSGPDFFPILALYTVAKEASVGGGVNGAPLAQIDKNGHPYAITAITATSITVTAGPGTGSTQTYTVDRTNLTTARILYVGPKYVPAKVPAQPTIAPNDWTPPAWLGSPADPNPPGITPDGHQGLWGPSPLAVAPSPIGIGGPSGPNIGLCNKWYVGARAIIGDPLSANALGGGSPPNPVAPGPWFVCNALPDPYTVSVGVCTTQEVKVDGQTSATFLSTPILNSIRPRNNGSNVGSPPGGSAPPVTSPSSTSSSSNSTSTNSSTNSTNTSNNSTTSTSNSSNTSTNNSNTTSTNGTNTSNNTTTSIGSTIGGTTNTTSTLGGSGTTTSSASSTFGTSGASTSFSTNSSTTNTTRTNSTSGAGTAAGTAATTNTTNTSTTGTTRTNSTSTNVTNNTGTTMTNSTNTTGTLGSGGTTSSTNSTGTTGTFNTSNTSNNSSTNGSTTSTTRANSTSTNSTGTTGTSSTNSTATAGGQSIP